MVGPESVKAELIHEDGLAPAREKQHVIGGLDQLVFLRLRIGAGWAPGAVGLLAVDDVGGEFAVPIVLAEMLETGGQADALEAEEVVSAVMAFGSGDLQAMVALLEPLEARGQ